LLEQE